jgi:hypothetical protein
MTTKATAIPKSGKTTDATEDAEEGAVEGSPYRARSGPPPGERRLRADSFEPEVYLGGRWWDEKHIVSLRLDHRLHELPEAAKQDLAKLVERDRIFRAQMGGWHPSLLGESPDTFRYRQIAESLERAKKLQTEAFIKSGLLPKEGVKEEVEAPPMRRMTFWQRLVWAFTRRVPWLPAARVRKPKATRK